MKVGRFVGGFFKPLEQSMYLSLGALAEHNQVYEIRIETSPLTEQGEMDVVSKLTQIKVLGMKVLGVDAHGILVKMQVQANQFAWAALLAILPQLIVPLIGLVIGIIVLTKLNEYSMPLIIIAGIGIAAYVLLKPGKNNKKR